MNSPQATQNSQIKNDTFATLSRLLERDFVNTGSHMTNCN